MKPYELIKDSHLQEYLDRWWVFVDKLPPDGFNIDLSDYQKSRYLSIRYIIHSDGFKLLTTYKQKTLLALNMDLDKPRSELIVSSEEGIRASGPFICMNESNIPQGIYTPTSFRKGPKSIGNFQPEYLDIVDKTVTHTLFTLVQGFNILYQMHELD